MLPPRSFFLLSVLTAVHASIGPSGDMYIVNSDVSPDGFTRPSILACSNASTASFPGVLVTATKGDRIRMNVVNHLKDTTMLTGTSIHWHGLFQKGTSWADGPSGVNQCPISPNNSFLYDFNVGDQAGTYWYHSHLGTQYCDGLRGAFIIYDPQDPFRHLYDVDDENTVITLADWYHIRSTSITDRATPDTTLINGLGRNCNGAATDLSVINVVQGKSYRFRLVSISCDSNFVFSVDGHNMTIIEVDGVNHSPLVVDSIQIYSGQRYSVIIAATQPIGNYWLRALPNGGCTSFAGGANSAIFRYHGAPLVEPTTTNSSLNNPLVETNLHPLESPGAPGGSAPADVSLCLNVTRVNGRFAINGASFQPPNVPVLLQIMSGARTAQDLLPSGNVYTLPRNKTIELIIPGGSTGSPHPFHLHGHNFDVVRSAGSTKYNYDNPVRRDVVSTGFAGDNVTIRFTTNNAGPWFLHCHIDWHLDNGLAVVFAEDVNSIAKGMEPEEWKELCPMYESAH